MTRSDALDRLRKLLRLADPERNSNEAERANAQAMAERLIKKHGFTPEDVCAATDGDRAGRSRASGRPGNPFEEGSWSHDAWKSAWPDMEDILREAAERAAREAKERRKREAWRSSTTGCWKCPRCGWTSPAPWVSAPSQCPNCRGKMDDGGNSTYTNARKQEQEYRRTVYERWRKKWDHSPFGSPFAEDSEAEAEEDFPKVSYDPCPRCGWGADLYIRMSWFKCPNCGYVVGSDERDKRRRKPPRKGREGGTAYILFDQAGLQIRTHGSDNLSFDNMHGRSATMSRERVQEIYESIGAWLRRMGK